MSGPVSHPDPAESRTVWAARVGEVTTGMKLVMTSATCGEVVRFGEKSCGEV